MLSAYTTGCSACTNIFISITLSAAPLIYGFFFVVVLFVSPLDQESKSFWAYLWRQVISCWSYHQLGFRRHGYQEVQIGFGHHGRGKAAASPARVHHQVDHQLTAQVGLPLLVHGEVTDDTVDFFDREKVFIERHMRPLVQDHPSLKIVMEHITTAEAADFVQSCGENVAATITCQHLLHTRNDIFNKGLRPHKYCLPILKKHEDRQALIAAIQSGSNKFFMGTDSAPHPKERKEAACCSAGCYTMHASLELYATAFREAGCLEHLPAFVSERGADFYGLLRNEGQVDILKESWMVPESYPLGNSEVVPLNAGEELTLRAVKTAQHHA
eukprot:m.106458 g.106458  ORF g.106458 m.106458 type:complete len:328 (+) comp15152_c2_seq4:741-1724(+)